MANRKTIVTLNEARALPRWRQPVALLLLMAFAMPLAFSTWSALPRVRARHACAISAQGAKYQRFGARRQGWFP